MALILTQKDLQEKNYLFPLKYFLLGKYQDGNPFLRKGIVFIPKDYSVSAQEHLTDIMIHINKPVCIVY